jgi:hypothetical protein
MPSLGQARTLDDLHLHLWRRSCADEPQTIYGMGSGASRARGGGAEGEDVVCMSYVSGRGPGVEPELPRPSTEHALPSYSTLPDGDIMHGQATFDGLQLMPGGMGRQLEREIIPQVNQDPWVFWMPMWEHDAARWGICVVVLCMLGEIIFSQHRTLHPAPPSL